MGDRMRILLINKFLHPNGGSETYVFKLGQQLASLGHEVQYFGMEHDGRIVGNRVEAYTSSMDFHHGSLLGKLTYPVKTIYSSEARKKLRLVLDDFQPDVCHLNNFNFQLTPSIILEIRKWSRQTGRPCRIVFTAHDYQLVCPNHMCYDPNSNSICEACLNGGFKSCVSRRCIHNSRIKSMIGSLEAAIWNKNGVYRQLDSIICCSEFLKTKLDTNSVLAEKTVARHNFIDREDPGNIRKKDYVLYFGRYAREKGIGTLVEAAKLLPEIKFVFAGSGPLEEMLSGVPNISNVGFQSGSDLARLIGEARFTVYPSEWYENCPFSVMESQLYGTPVLGADIGGIPELIENGVTGELFRSGCADDLRSRIEQMWNDQEKTERYSRSCRSVEFESTAQYCEWLLGSCYR